jgi:hypothetical protein
MMRQTCILTTVATLLLLGTGALAEMSFYVPHKGKTGKTEWTNKKKIAEPIRFAARACVHLICFGFHAA